MAFGLGFNKAKVQTAAEKFVAQGKVPAAIEEYRKILQHDPQDLMVLNTVAYLYARSGKNDEAVKRFKELAEKCLETGLVLRAIAVYKRITKIVPDSAESLQRLGELYSMQGLLRDARMHYLQAVEIYLQRKQKEKARDVFEQILMLDMENPQIQARMAELYAETGKKEEAVASYLAAAERFLDKNLPAEADAAIQALSRLDPQNPDMLVLLGRAQLERGEFAKAVETLQPIPSLSTQKGPLNLLFHAYTKLGDTANAKIIATQLFDAHEDFAGLAQVSEELISRGQVDEASEIYEASYDRLMAQRASALLLEGLQKIRAANPSHIGALQLLAKLYHATGQVGEAHETSELLAHAYVARGELEKAREIYTELAMIEPENPDHLKLLRQVEAQMGISVETPEVFSPIDEPFDSPASMLPDLSAAHEEVEAEKEAGLPDHEEQLIKDCITESDLYKTYHQIGKAIETLEQGLTQLPGNITLTEHLLALYEDTQDYAKAAQCCEALTEAYVTLGDGERATRYGELILTYQQKAKEAPSQPSPAPAAETASMWGATEEDAFAPAAPAPSAEEQAQVHEVDLSMEWASVSSSDQAAPAALEDNAVEEIEFYIQAGLTADAIAALDQLRERSPSHPAISQFEERLGIAPTVSPTAAPQSAPSPEAPTDFSQMLAEKNLAAGVSPNIEPVSQGLEEDSSPAGFPPPYAPPPASIPTPAVHEEFALEEAFPAMDVMLPSQEFELSLDETAPQPPPIATPLAPPAPQDVIKPPAPAPVATPAQSADAFADLAAELESSLTLPDQPVKERTPSAPSQPAVAAAASLASTPSPASPAQFNPLQDMFAEFQAEMDQPTEAEDLETHYNMGVAFKEMALYDEAIGEFQKVQQLAEERKDYSHNLQCCSLLATCFQEKGLPLLAVKWYQTALDSPEIDPEGRMAFLYEMASAYENGGDRQAALRSFLEVYARNIDYRDVADRIRTLQQVQ